MTTVPRKLPSAELKMAAASLPPAALVNMTAEETGGGMQPTINSLREERRGKKIKRGKKERAEKERIKERIKESRMREREKKKKKNEEE